MPKRLKPSQVELYYAARANGKSIRVSMVAPGVGISYSSANLLEQRRKLSDTAEGRDPNLLAAMMRVGNPRPYERLGENAKRAFDDFSFFQSYYLGRISQPWQIEAAEKLVTLLESPAKEYCVVNAPPGGGKPLHVDSLIAMGDGSRKRLGDVEVGDWVMSHKGRACRVAETFDQGVLPLVAVTDDYGRTIDANDEHPFLTASGNFVEASRLGAWNLANPPESEPVIGTYRSEFEFRMAGYFVGDGSCKSSTFCITNDDPGIIEDVFACARAMGWGGVNVKPRNRCQSVTQFGRKCRPWLLEARLVGCDSWTKRVPAWVFTAPNHRVAQFLGAYFDCDGYVDASGRSVEYDSVNEDLLRDTAHLLRRLGIRCTLRRKKGSYQGKVHWSWRLVVIDRAVFASQVKSRGAKARRLDLCAPRDRGCGGTSGPVGSAAIERIAPGPCRCLTIEDDHTFIANDFPVHNTLLFTHDIPCWLTIRNRAIRGLIGSATQSLANRNVARLRRTLERPVLLSPDETLVRQGYAVEPKGILARDFGRFKPLERELWTKDAFIVMQYDAASIVEKEPTWSAYGMDTGYIGGRYDFVIWDDLVDPRKLRSIEQKEALEQNWTDVAETRLEPSGLLVLQGQRLSSDDLYRFALDMKGGIEDEDGEEMDPDAPRVLYGDRAGMKYHHIIFKAHYEDRCTEANHKRGAPSYPEGCLLSTWRLPWREIKALMANQAERFEVIYQQEDSAQSEVLVPKNWIYGDSSHYGCLDSTRGMLEVPKGLHGLFSVVTVDPSPTALWGICHWLYHPESEQRFLFNLENRKMDASDLLDFNYNEGVFYGLMEEWQSTSRALGVPITHWIVEINAAQRFLLQYDHTRRWSSLNHVEILPHSTTRNKIDDEFGVWSIRHHYEFGRYRLPYKIGSEGRAKTMRLVNELVRYPQGRTDDLVMANWFFEWQLPRIYAPPRAHTPQTRPSWLVNA